MCLCVYEYRRAVKLYLNHQLTLVSNLDKHLVVVANQKFGQISYPYLDKTGFLLLDGSRYPQHNYFVHSGHLF
jgi:hypothetical protein